MQILKFQIESLHVIMRQTTTIGAIADGVENGTRQEMRDWWVVLIVRVGRLAVQGNLPCQSWYFALTRVTEIS